MSPYLTAALHTAGQLPSERLPWIAADWLVEGHDGPALRELASMGVSEHREAAALLPAALAETGLAPLSEEQVARAFLDHLYTCVLDGSLSEGDLCFRMSDLREYDDAVRDVWPFDELAALDYEFAAYPDTPAFMPVEGVRRLCREHRQRYFGGESLV